jgi:3-hydroxymyristoyl/3-hydroxydecanoyl-(acyl carrier protein) dehydratase
MDFEIHRVIPDDHPSLPGHFPGAPIVPGVVILDETLAALMKWRKNCRVTAIPTVKFLAPLRPEQPFTISLAENQNAQGEVNFICRAQDRVIAEGRFQVC